jgi:DNA polymerase-1
MLMLMRKSTERIELIDRFKRPTEEHLNEQCQLRRLVGFVTAFIQLNAKQKMISTYTSYPIGDDGRVHPSFLIHGTATGRLSCKEPNLQNQPDEVRRIFMAEEGCLFVQADYSNLELRVLAYAANDPTLQAPFLEGKNVHDTNTRELFGVQPDEPSWKAFRRAAKVYIFGRNYGGGLEGMYRRVTLEVPEANLSFARFKAVDERYREAHPGYTVWAETLRRDVLATRRGRNLFGRTRTFYGNDNDVVKEGLNHPIQSTAADIINPVTIALWKRGLPLVCQVHDSLLFEVKEADVEEAKAVIRQEMERGFSLNGQSVAFPVDITVGRSWGELA